MPWEFATREVHSLVLEAAAGARLSGICRYFIELQRQKQTMVRAGN